MKTQKTTKESFELLKKVSETFDINTKSKMPTFLRNVSLLNNEIKSFISKDDSEAEIYSDCINFISKVNQKEYNKDESNECPMNNLIDRLTTMYPLVSKNLDTNVDFGDKVPNIFQQYQYAFKKHGFTMDTWHSKNDTFYYVLEHKSGHVYTSEKESNYEFEQTAQMACIEKAFEFCNKNIFDAMATHTSHTINKSTKTINLLEKFEDWHAEKEYEHLKTGTEFEPKEMFDFFKPYLNFNGC
jgi:hypothetical protein